MFDNQNSVSLIDKSCQHRQQSTHVLKMQSSSWFVQQIDRVAGASLGQFGRQLDTLCFTTRECWCRLTKSYIAKSHIYERLHVSRNTGLFCKELNGFRDGHVQHIRNVFAFKCDVESVTVVPCAFAHLTRNIHVWQKVHLNFNGSIARASLTTTPRHVETKSTRHVPTYLRFRCRAEQLANVVKNTCVSCRV